MRRSPSLPTRGESKLSDVGSHISQFLLLNNIIYYRCVGVWDTVGSIFGTIDVLSIKDTSLPPTIEYALHAISLQENRKKSLPTLWTIPPQGLAAEQILKQV